MPIPLPCISEALPHSVLGSYPDTCFGQWDVRHVTAKARKITFTFSLIICGLFHKRGLAWDRRDTWSRVKSPQLQSHGHPWSSSSQPTPQTCDRPSHFQQSWLADHPGMSKKQALSEATEVLWLLLCTTVAINSWYKFQQRFPVSSTSWADFWTIGENQLWLFLQIPGSWKTHRAPCYLGDLVPPSLAELPRPN